MLSFRDSFSQSKLKLSKVRACIARVSKDLNIKAVEDLLAEINVLPFDVPSDAEYGGIRSMVEAAGKPIGGNDLLIASTLIQ